MSTIRWCTWLSLGAGILAGCSNERDRMSSEPTHALRPRSSAPLTLEKIQNRAALSFYDVATDHPRGSYDVGTHAWYARVEGPRLSLAVQDASTGEIPEPVASFEVASLGRVGWSWEPVTYDRDDDGRMRRESQGVVETLSGENEGIEQSWDFDALPAGDGALSVRIRVDGAGLVTADDRGLVLRTSTGSMRYGVATWIGGDGKTQRILPQWEDGFIAIEIPAATLATTVFPATLDPLLGPEVSTDGPLVQSKGLQNVRFGCSAGGCIAYGVDNYGGPSTKVHVRFGLDGTLLDPHPVPDSNFAKIEDIQPFGSDLLVLYRTSDTALTSPVLVQRITVDGALVGSPLAIGNGVPVHDESAQLACGPAVCLAIWRDSNQNPKIFGKRFDYSLTDLDPFGFFITSGGATSSSEHRIAVAFNGSKFLVGRYGSNAVTRVDTAGNVMDPLGLPVTNCPIIASNGTDWLCTAYPKRHAIHDDGTIFSTVTPGTPNGPDTLIWTGSTYLEARSGSVYPIGADGTAGAPLAYGPLGTSRLTLQRRSSLGAVLFYSNSYTKLLDASGTPDGPTFFLNPSANAQGKSVLVAGNNQFLLAWYDNRLHSMGLYAERLAPDGTPIDLAPILVSQYSCPGAPLSYCSSPDSYSNFHALSGAFNGSTYLVASEASPLTTEAVATRTIGLDGTVGATNSIAFSTCPETTALSSNGNIFYLTCEGHGGRLTATGLLIDNFTASGYTAFAPAAFDGTAFVHVLPQGYSGAGTYSRITPGGVMIEDNIPFGGLGSNSGAAVACTTGECLLFNGKNFAAIPMASVTPTAPLAIQGESSMAGANGLFTIVASTPATGLADVTFGRFTATNPPTQVGGWVNVTNTPNEAEYNPHVAMLDDGTTLISYERTDLDLRAMRLYVRTLSAGTLGTGCTGDVDCASGHCSDGVCCNASCGSSNTADCQACSVASGASADGHCSTLGGNALCRPAVGDCDVAENCDGTSTACPVDTPKPDGTACSDANACSSQDACANGTCVPGAAVICMPPNECQSGFCDNVMGCSYANKSDGTPCTIGSCTGGMCEASSTSSGSSASTSTSSSASTSGASSAAVSSSSSVGSSTSSGATSTSDGSATATTGGGSDTSTSGQPGTGAGGAGTGGGRTTSGGSSGCSCTAAEANDDGGTSPTFVAAALLGLALRARKRRSNARRSNVSSVVAGTRPM